MNTPVYNSPSQLRAAIRSGEYNGPTAGQCPGYVQANVVMLPEADAEQFLGFCHLNPRPCPVIAQTAPGEPFFPEVAAKADICSDVPRYRVFYYGIPREEEPTNIAHLWEEDFVAILLGCSFTFENALQRQGFTLRHLQMGCNVPMYRTNVECNSWGAYAGNLVVSMRPFVAEAVPHVYEITRQYPQMHGGPVHSGDPLEIGITNLSQPDFGDPVPIWDDEVPVFWACGVTPQLALAAARPEIAITHSPGHMFVTDLKEESFREGSGFAE